MKVKSIQMITPEPSRCISVDSPGRMFAIKTGDKEIATKNSVAQQNIIISCLLRPEHWVILGIDLKRVELSRYREFGMKAATDLETAIEFLRFGQAVMMSRYTAMEAAGENSYSDMPGHTQSLLIMIDEAGELLSPTGAKSDEAKAMDELKAEAVMIIGSIARLGRAAGVHLVVATQRPDAKIIPGEVRDNFGARVGCGTLQPSASTMILGSNVGQRIPSNPKGGIYIQCYGKGNLGQGFFAPNSWLGDYFKRTGKPIPGTTQGDGPSMELPDDTPKAKEGRPEDDWDSDMDELTED